MITAVDSSVLIKIFKLEQDAPLAVQALESAVSDGNVIICPVVVAELGRAVKSNDQLHDFLEAAQINHSPLGSEVAYVAAQIMREYAKNKGDRSRIAADFLIGAHAMTHADQLLTADKGFMRDYFRDLKIVGI